MSCFGFLCIFIGIETECWLERVVSMCTSAEFMSIWHYCTSNGMYSPQGTVLSSRLMCLSRRARRVEFIK